MSKLLLTLCLIAAPYLIHAQNGFIENKGEVTDQNGQSRNDIDFKLKATKGLNLFIGNGHLHYQWIKADQIKREKPTLIKKPQENNTPVEFYRMDMVLMNANPQAEVIKEKKQPYFERYYLTANNFSGTTAASFEKITYKDIYPHIDWVLYRNANGSIEYDFVIHPGGNVSDIKLQYNGTNSLNLNNDKSLTAKTPYGSITENAPVAYEKETHQGIATSFVLKDNILSFSAADYNGTLIIDPTLIWGTYFGGTDGEMAYDIISNKDGNTYMTGGTSSTTNIATTGAYQTTYNGGQSYLNDAFIAKFNLAGECLWATYYGTSDEDCAKSITHDTAGNIYIGGYTFSNTGMGTEEGSYQEESGGDYDAFVAKFDTDGNRIWSTYFGGPSTDCWGAVAIAADKHDNVYLTGQTASATGIATPDAYQTSLGDPFANNCFVAKFNIAGSLQWSTYYGGTQGDAPLGIATDTTGAVYIAGYTNSTTGIATPSGQQSTPGGDLDGFLSKFDPSGDLVWGTYFGGDNYDQVNSVACDSQLNVYIVGITASTTGISTQASYQPEYGGGFQDGMLAKYDASGILQWATYYGNSGEDGVDRVIVGHNEDIYVSGTSSGTDNIATPDGFQPTPGGSFDAVISRFNAGGDLVWGSFLGGPDYDEAFGLTQDAVDNLYIAGETQSGAGIATEGAWQEGYGGSDDGFLVVIKDCTPPVTPDSISGLHSICAGSANTYSVAVAPNTEYIWILPDGWQGSSATNSIDAVAGDNGGTIKIIAFNACDTSDTVTLDVTVMPIPETPQITAEGPNLSTTTNYSSYQWSKDGNLIAGATSPSYTAVASGSYTVTVTNESGCTATSEPYAYNATGVNFMNTDKVVIFPNPFTNTLNLQLPYDADIKLCNAVGQTLLTKSCKRGMNSIITNDIANGLYFLQVTHKGTAKASIFKIVKAEQ